MTASKLTFVTTLLLALALSMASLATPIPSEPRAIVERTADAVAKLAERSEGRSELRAGLDGLLGDVVDFRTFGARSLKGQWATLSEPEKARFEVAFRGLVLSIYAKRIKPKTRFITRFRRDDVSLATSRVRVHTILESEGMGADVDYEFERVAMGKVTQWRVNDLIIDGVSMVQTWRRGFKRVLKRDGFEGLIDKIERKASRP